MRKRIAALALAAVMAFGLAGCGGSSSSTAGSAQSGATGVSGEFTGTAQGMGEVTVTVTLTDGAITGCVIEGPDETEGIGSVVLENAPNEIVSANKGSIDVVAGATITSNAVNEALAAALAAAGLDAADFTGSAAEGQTAEDKVIDTDVVVVGAGGAGMTAAITAAQPGRNVVVQGC